jgi:methionine biosynthesis protein MetW
MRNRIVSFVSPHSKILDLGCGNGELLTTLKKDKQCYCYGVDINYDNIVACTARGISVFQGDLDDGLSGFSDQSYNVVILSQTLQQVRRPLFVIEEMLRVGKMAVVTFPNFAHWKTRLQLLFGKIPQTKTLPYHWHDTPNIRVISISSFRDLCDEKGIDIVKENHVSPLPTGSNMFASRGVFLIKKTEKSKT